MSSTLVLSAYDLTDEGPARSFNEDATLVRDDLGLFAVADGAGGKGKGDVASALALRSLENYVGATVRAAFESPDHDLLGNAEQARRLSRAVHRAHKNLREAQVGSAERAGMAATLTALLVGPRTGEVHLAHVGDSRCYRLRHGRLEQLSDDHSVARDVLERRPELDADVLSRLPKNAVVRALGMHQELRVTMRSFLLAPGDRFLLCTDGLSSVVPFQRLWRVLREADPPSVVASELLSHALAAEGRDNVALVVIDVEEQEVDENVPTRPYNRAPISSRLQTALQELPEEDDLPPTSAAILDFGPELATDEFLSRIEDWDDEDAAEAPPGSEPSGVAVEPARLAPAVEVPHHAHGFEPGEGAVVEWDDDPPESYNLDEQDVEVESEGDLDVDDGLSPDREK
ncbi:MAG TPA: PP2C family serine/threonine-protein phosphatase [Polyangiaceae bacterium]|nr:PP2C family serine/threonine-protein phosphatase [Polyangiaceae bacterium]